MYVLATAYSYIRGNLIWKASNGPKATDYHYDIPYSHPSLIDLSLTTALLRVLPQLGISASGSFPSLQTIPFPSAGSWYQPCLASPLASIPLLL